METSVLISNMIIGDRLRALREEKKFSQGDIEKRTGLLRCYISRVENGHTVPAIETLEKLARALEVPLYQSYMTAKNHPNFRTFPNASRRTTLRGAVPARKRGSCISSAASWAVSTSLNASSCSTWPKLSAR